MRDRAAASAASASAFAATTKCTLARTRLEARQSQRRAGMSLLWMIGGHLNSFEIEKS